MVNNMFIQDTLTVYKKEVRSILKDRSVLLMCVLLPFLIMFGEGKLMTMMNNSEKDSKSYHAYVINEPEYMKAPLKEIGFSGAPDDVEKCITAIKNKSIG